MVDSLNLIYSELWKFQIPEFAQFRNSQVMVSSGYPEIREFATVITQNISDLESKPWKSKLFRMQFSGR